MSERDAGIQPGFRSGDQFLALTFHCRYSYLVREAGSLPLPAKVLLI